MRNFTSEFNKEKEENSALNALVKEYDRVVNEFHVNTRQVEEKLTALTKMIDDFSALTKSKGIDPNEFLLQHLSAEQIAWIKDHELDLKDGKREDAKKVVAEEVENSKKTVSDREKLYKNVKRSVKQKWIPMD